jgi:hypothetical protein
VPLIYLKHPVHGRKIATLDLEAEYDEQNGWERYTPGQIEAPEDAAVFNALTPRGRRRREQGYAEIL